jgi:prepilin-type N-terminal cleavage/methylation domain-containing protein
MAVAFPTAPGRNHLGKDRPMALNRRRRGFTLIELLIAVVVLGILASIVMPNFKSTKGKSYAATLRTDLRNLATAEESYFYDTGAYASTAAATGFQGSAGVTITISQATMSGWSGTATHPLADPQTCAVFYGNATPVAPATAEGEIACQ